MEPENRYGIVPRRDRAVTGGGYRAGAIPIIITRSVPLSRSRCFYRNISEERTSKKVWSQDTRMQGYSVRKTC
jgi:hypothetical protein